MTDEPKRERRPYTVSVTLTAAEFEALQRLAGVDGASLAGAMRALLVRATAAQLTDKREQGA
jgi:hypothetical protein